MAERSGASGEAPPSPFGIGADAINPNVPSTEKKPTTPTISIFRFALNQDTPKEQNRRTKLKRRSNSFEHVTHSLVPRRMLPRGSILCDRRSMAVRWKRKETKGSGEETESRMALAKLNTFGLIGIDSDEILRDHTYPVEFAGATGEEAAKRTLVITAGRSRNSLLPQPNEPVLQTLWQMTFASNTGCRREHGSFGYLPIENLLCSLV